MSDLYSTANGPAGEYQSEARPQRVVMEYPNAEVPARPQSHLLAILSGLAAFALLAGLVYVGLQNRAPATAPPAALPPVILDPGFTPGTIDPQVGLPVDGYGALTQAVAAPVVVDIFSDFACPFCANFEANYAGQLMQLAENPDVSLRWHPVAVLDHSGNGTGFSTQAAAIFLQIAETHPQYVWAVNDFFLANQGELANLSGQQIVDILGDSDMPLPPFETVMANQSNLLNQFTTAFRNSGGTGVPFILINGEQWTPGDLPWPNISLVEAAQAAASIE